MNNDPYKKIILVTNGLRDSEPVHESAFNLARKHNSNLRIVDTVKPPTTMAKWLTPNANEIFEFVFRDKQKRLDNLAEKFSSRGIDVDTKVLIGKSSLAISEEAAKWNADLVVRYMKGAYSKFTGLVGNTARSLMRYCPTPILLIGKKPIDNPKVIACVDVEHGSSENDAIIAEASRLVSDKNDLTGLYCWEVFGRSLLKNRMDSDSFQEMLDFTENSYRKSLDEFVGKCDFEKFGNGIQLFNGEPSTVIPMLCKDQKTDVVVMCSATLNHPLKRYFGSTIESVIERLPCNLLVVKPNGFVTPLKFQKENVVETV